MNWRTFVPLSLFALDQEVAALKEALAPALCPEQAGSRCRYQDPLLHGQLEAIRHGYRAREYSAE